MLVWRVSKNSMLLAVSQELRDDDQSAHDEDLKYGIEISKGHI